MPQKPNGPPWPDIAKGLDQHVAENVLTQRDDALARIDAANASIAKVQADHDAIVKDLQERVKDLSEKLAAAAEERDAVKTDRDSLVEALGGTDAGKKLLAARELTALQKQAAELGYVLTPGETK